MLDVDGEARVRVNEYNHLIIRSQNSGSDEDAYIDFVDFDYPDLITPTARIEFDAADPMTYTTGIQFYTRASDDPEILNRLSIEGEGDVRPGQDQLQNLGTIDYRWLKVYTKDGVDQLSDGRYKENVSGLPIGLEEVLILRPVSFSWKDGPDQGLKYGLIAQEVADVLPEIVSGNEDGQPLSLNYDELTPVLVNAIQEQQVQIEDQAHQIADLEARLDALDGGGSGLLSGFNPAWTVLFVAIAVVAVGSHNRRREGRA
jgi:hypothetical protein